MAFWRRPLHAMTDAFTAAGFRLTVISEPQPDLAPASPTLTTSRTSRPQCASCSSFWRCPRYWLLGVPSIYYAVIDRGEQLEGV